MSRAGFRVVLSLPALLLTASFTGCATGGPAPARTAPAPSAAAPAGASTAASPSPAVSPVPPATQATASSGTQAAASTSPGTDAPVGRASADAAGRDSAGAALPVGAVAAFAAPAASPPPTAAPNQNSGDPARPAAAASGAAMVPSRRPTADGRVDLSLGPVSGSARVGASVEVAIDIVATATVIDAPLHVVFDPSAVRFEEAREGNFMNADGGGTVFLVNGRSRPGDVVIGIGRTDRARGVTGRGTLAVVRFTALDAGTTTVAIGPAQAWAPGDSTVAVGTADAVQIEILP